MDKYSLNKRGNAGKKNENERLPKSLKAVISMMMRARNLIKPTKLTIITFIITCHHNIKS